MGGGVFSIEIRTDHGRRGSVRWGLENGRAVEWKRSSLSTPGAGMQMYAQFPRAAFLRSAAKRIITAGQSLFAESRILCNQMLVRAVPNLRHQPHLPVTIMRHITRLNSAVAPQDPDTCREPPGIPALQNSQWGGAQEEALDHRSALRICFTTALPTHGHDTTRSFMNVFQT